MPSPRNHDDYPTCDDCGADASWNDWHQAYLCERCEEDRHEWEECEDCGSDLAEWCEEHQACLCDLCASERYK